MSWSLWENFDNHFNQLGNLNLIEKARVGLGYRLLYILRVFWLDVISTFLLYLWAWWISEFQNKIYFVESASISLFLAGCTTFCEVLSSITWSYKRLFCFGGRTTVPRNEMSVREFHRKMQSSYSLHENKLKTKRAFQCKMLIIIRICTN